MSKAIIIAVVFAGGFVGLLIWIMSGAAEQLQTRDELVEDDGRSLKHSTRPSRDQDINIPNRPRKAAHVLVEMRCNGRMKTTLRNGGPIVLSIRGNGVTYRRRALDSAIWDRHRVKTAAVDKVIATVAGLPVAMTGGGGLAVDLDVGKGIVRHYATPQEAQEILEAASGRADPFTPAAIILHTVASPSVPRLEDPDWPKLGGLNPPSAYVAQGAEFRAPKSEMTKLLAILQKSRLLNAEDKAWLLASWHVVLP
ncbi:MAG: hypothetical protein CMJ83_13580 [Planctomycetes bacterium]|nr:hypothetical protein [Planctomycetota bacterium]